MKIKQSPLFSPWRTWNSAFFYVLFLCSAIILPPRVGFRLSEIFLVLLFFREVLNFVCILWVCTVTLYRLLICVPAMYLVVRLTAWATSAISVEATMYDYWLLSRVTTTIIQLLGYSCRHDYYKNSCDY